MVIKDVGFGGELVNITMGRFQVKLKERSAGIYIY